MDIYATNWTEADASNSTAAPDGWPEGMMPSGVDDAGRAMMGATKRYVDQQIPLVTGGTSTAYTLAYAVAPAQLYDGMTHLVQFNAVNGAAPTLNVNALGAKPLHFYAGAAWGACPANMFAVDQIVRVTYNAAAGTYRCIDTPMILNQSFSGVTAVNFQNIPTNVTTLEVIFDLTFATGGAQLFLRFYNSGGSLDSSAVYGTSLVITDSLGTAPAASAGTTAGAISLSAAVSTSTTFATSGVVNINNIQGVKDTQCTLAVSWPDSGGVVSKGATGWAFRAANGNITGIQLAPSSGTFSGVITVRAK